MMRLLLSLVAIVCATGTERLSAVIFSPFVNGPFIEALFNARAVLPLQFKILVVTAQAHQQQIDSYGSLNITALRLFDVPVSILGYSNLLISCSFWDALETEHVLIFQSDSRFCNNSGYSIDFFLQKGFDWLGAPWRAGAHWDPLGVAHSLVGNGGFSLRRRSSMSRCCVPRQRRWQENEDTHFVRCLDELGAPSAPVELAEKFAAETYFRGDTVRAPFGVHKTYAYVNGENRTLLHRLCPESLDLERWFAKKNS